jgi:hypothetical protein
MFEILRLTEVISSFLCWKLRIWVAGDCAAKLRDLSLELAGGVARHDPVGDVVFFLVLSRVTC